MESYATFCRIGEIEFKIKKTCFCSVNSVALNSTNIKYEVHRCLSNKRSMCDIN